MTSLPRLAHRRCFAAAAIALVWALLSSTNAGALNAPSAPGALPSPSFLDGDFVVFDAGLDSGRREPVQAKDGDGSNAGPVTNRDGYATFGDPRLLDHYDVRLVDSDRVEELRPLLTRAVDDTVGAAGQSLRVAPGVIRNQGTGRGQIDVVVSTASPCGGSWLACGGPTIDEGKVVSGRIWVHPKLLEHPAYKIDNTLRHELGHTLGLAHYSGAVDGRLQTMHPTRFDARRWETGDRRGLRVLSGAGPAPVVVLDAVRVDDGILQVHGRVEDARAGTVLLLTIDGATERWVMDRSNFQRSRAVGGGTHEVCAAIERDGMPDGTVCETVVTGADPGGEIEQIGAGTHGIEIVGWARDPQTAAPITVVISVGERVVELQADEAHDPASHPAHGSTNGFHSIIPVEAGEHSVCVTARNVGDGADVVLGCRVVAVSQLTVGRIGLQTI